jgi:[citrate (pro-3S)-lyase] ligase
MITSYGVELIEIQRKKYNGSEISASDVRKLIKKKNFNLIKAIVPETTYEYIINRFS